MPDKVGVRDGRTLRQGKVGSVHLLVLRLLALQLLLLPLLVLHLSRGRLDRVRAREPALHQQRAVRLARQMRRGTCHRAGDLQVLPASGRCSTQPLIRLMCRMVFI